MYVMNCFYFCFFIIIFNLAFTVNSTEYSSIGQPSILFDFEKNLVYQGDVITDMSSCTKAGLTSCITFNGNVITVTENLLLDKPKPIRIKIDDDSEVLSLPILQHVKILGTRFEGYFLTVKNSINDKKNVIFYTKKRGVISFSLNGTLYWSTTHCGLFSQKKCKGK